MATAKREPLPIGSEIELARGLDQTLPREKVFRIIEQIGSGKLAFSYKAEEIGRAKKYCTGKTPIALINEFFPEDLAYSLIRKHGVNGNVPGDVYVSVSQSSEARYKQMLCCFINCSESHINRAFELYSGGNTFYSVAENLDGTLLRHIDIHHTQLTLQDKLETILSLLDEVSSIHKNGFISQDISLKRVYKMKGENRVVLLNNNVLSNVQEIRRGEYLKKSRGNSCAAPEQYVTRSFRHIGPATDIFSIGGVLFYLLTGRELQYSEDIVFGGAGWKREMRALLPEAARSALADELAKIIKKSLASVPDSRYATPKMLKADIMSVA